MRAPADWVSTLDGQELNWLSRFWQQICTMPTDDWRMEIVGRRGELPQVMVVRKQLTIAHERLAYSSRREVRIRAN